MVHCEAVSYMNVYNILHLVVWVFINCKCLWVFKYIHIYVCVYLCVRAHFSVCLLVCMRFFGSKECLC